MRMGMLNEVEIYLFYVLVFSKCKHNYSYTEIKKTLQTSENNHRPF